MSRAVDLGQVAIVVPARNTHATLPRVIAELPAELRARTFVVDDGSQPALVADGVTLLRHDPGRGYGAAQKTGYAAAIDAGAELVLLLHGDGQYATEEVLGLAACFSDPDVAAALGSRFLEGGGRGIPSWRRWGNRLLTKTANLRFGTELTELHSGARAFRTSVLAGLPLARFSDDYVFDQQVLVALLARGQRIAEAPATPRYDDSVQSISLGGSVRYGLGCLGAIARGDPAR